MKRGRLAKKIWALVLVAAMLLMAVPMVWAEEAPANKHTFTLSNIKDELGQTLAPVSITFTAAQQTNPVDPPNPETPKKNERLYRNTFSDAWPEHIAWCFGVEAAVSKSNDAYSGNSAVKITNSATATENIAGMRLYKDTGLYDVIEADKNYVFSIMMKALPYSDGAQEYPVTYTTQIKPGNLEYRFGGSVTSDGQWHRVLIPFNTTGYLGLNGSDGNFNFQVWTARGNLGNDQLPADVTRFAEYIVDDFELYQAAPVTLTKSSIADGADDVSASVTGITFSFNNGMDDTTALNAGNYTLTGNTISKVEKNTDGSYTAIFGSPLAENTAYTFAMSGLKDELQQEMAGSSIAFTTTEAGAPQVLSTNPANNAINVKTDTAMTVGFDSAVTAVTKDNVLVNGEKANVADVSMNGANEAVVTFAGLDYGKLYQVTLTGITGLTGKPVAAYTTQFVTEVQNSVLYRNTFESDMDLQTPQWIAESMPFALDSSEAATGTSSVKLSPTAPGQQLTFMADAASKMVKGQTYMISLTAKSTATTNNGFYVVRPDEGIFCLTVPAMSAEWQTYASPFVYNGDAAGGIIRITQEAQAIPFYIDDLMIYEPASTQVLPNSDILDGVQNVSVSGPYTLYFNNAMDTATLTGENITINGTAVTVTGVTENTVTFIPAAALAYDSINTLAVNVKDAGGADVTYAATFQTAGVFDAGALQLLAGQTIVTDGMLAAKTTYTAVLPTLSNNADTASDAVLVIALYDGNVMVAADFAAVKLNGGASIDTPLTAEITSPASFAGTPTLKAFLWNGFDHIAPIADYIAVTGVAQ